MFKERRLATHIKAALFASVSVMTSSALAAEEVKEEKPELKDVETIQVTGVRNALKESLFLKKSASQIVDAISSEDVGKLPDLNVAEAMQRITGIQINRNDAGDGQGFQVRGLSQNRVEVNGRSLASNGDGDRGNAVNSLSSALFKGIEVYKSPTADMTEGALGATVRLQTWKPLDFKKDVTFVGSAQGIESSNEDKGMLGTALVATRWELDGLGTMGALINVSYDERDVTTNRWGVNWVGTPGIDQIGCTDRFKQTCGDSIATGTIIQPDGSALDGQLYPYLDPDPSAHGSKNDPMLQYTMYHPSDFVYERKPFHNEKVGVDASLQWAPNESMEFTLSAMLNKFDQFRPQTKTVAPGAKKWNSASLQDDFVIQQFSRETQGEYYSDGSQPDEVIRGAVVRGMSARDTVRFANNNANKEEETKSIALDFKYMADSWNMDASVSHVKSDTFEDGRNLNMEYMNAPSMVWDFTKSLYDLPISGLVMPGYEFNFDTVTCHKLDENGAAMEAASADCGMREMLTEYKPETDNFYKFGGFNGNYNWWGNEESEAKLDFDFEIDTAGITVAEFGVRATTGEYYRERSQIKRIDSISRNANANNTLDPILGDVDGDGVAGNGNNSFLMMETFEPGFVTNNIAVAPEWLDAVSGSPMTPRQWLTPTATSYEDLFVRLTAHGFFRNLTEQKFTIEEDTLAAYAKLNFEYDLSFAQVTGNFGVRYINYDYNSKGFQVGEGQVEVDVVSIAGIEGTVLEPNYVPASLTRTVTDWLPSLNLNFMLSENTFIRFAAAKVVSMPNPSDLAFTAPSINASAAVVTGKRGNPNLNPYAANQLDLSFEWYMSDTSALTAGLFYKDIENFIIETAVSEQFDNPDCTLNAPSDWPGFAEYESGDTSHHYCFDLENSVDDIDPDNDLYPSKVGRITQPQNGGAGSVQGVELAYRTFFDFLPGFASGFGMEANYTYTDSEQESGINELTGEKLGVENLSENSYNFSLFYEKYGLSFRAAYNYRDSSFKGFETQVGDTGGLTIRSQSLDPNVPDNYDIRYQNGLPIFEDSRGQLDVSASYKINDHFTIFAQANNLTKESTEKYSGVEMLRKEYLEGVASYRLGIRASFR